jgi:hypothetical protein
VELDFLERFHLLFQYSDFVLQAFATNFGNDGLLPVSRIEIDQVAIDARFDFFHPSLQLGAGEISVTIVNRLELAAINGNQRLGEQTKPLAQHDELSANVPDCFAIVFAETCNRFEVRHQPSSQPHQFDVALTLFLKATAGLNPIQVAVNV